MATTLASGAGQAGADHPPLIEDAAVHRRGDRFVATGLLVIAAVFTVVQVLAGELIPPLALPVVLYTVLGAALLRWRPRWLLVVAAVLPVVHLVASIEFLASNLAHPESPGSFIPEAFVTIAAVTVVIGAVMGLRGAAGRSRRPVTLVAGVAAAAVVIVSLAAASGVESDARRPGDIAVETVRAQFPERLEVPAGGAVLWVDNQDAFRHTIVIDGTGVHAELPGSTAARVPTDLAPGTYRYWCDVPGHDGMGGEILAR